MHVTRGARPVHSDRPPTGVGKQRAGGHHQGAARGRRDANASMDPTDEEYDVEPVVTTVHDVVVIPGYFSSGEEDQGPHTQHQNFFAD